METMEAHNQAVPTTTLTEETTEATTLTAETTEKKEVEDRGRGQEARCISMS